MAEDQHAQTKLGRETAVRPTLLLMVGGTHRQESPGHWSDFPGNAWPAPLPQFIYKQKTGSLDQLLPQRPEPALARCLLPPNKIPTALLAETSRERLHSTVPSSRVPRAPASQGLREAVDVYEESGSWPGLAALRGMHHGFFRLESVAPELLCAFQFLRNPGTPAGSEALRPLVLLCIP